jgi:tetratricopeptide (TPR) repeat protein
MIYGAAFSTVTCITATWFVGVSLSGQTSPVSASFRPAASTTTARPQSAGPAATVVSSETRGDIFMARKMYREAIEAYKEAPSDSAVAQNKTGIAYHQMLDLNTAKKYYQRAVKIDPRYPEAINNLGTIEYSRKNYRRAVSLYKKALRLSPNSASIYSNLGTGYFARKDYKAATEAFTKALSLDPEVFEHKSTHGVLLQERSVEERAKYHYYLAKMYAQAGTNDRALMYIRKALEEGFKDKKKFQEEPEFARMRDLPEFKELLAMDHRVL